MIIEKTENELTLILENEETVYDVVSSDDFFMADLQFYHSSVDGWQYIYDANRNKVCYVTDYGFDEFDTLLEHGQVTLTYKENDLELYGEYEWNEGVE